MVGDGLVVYNVCSRKEEYYSVFKRQFMAVFKNVVAFQSEDKNQMFAASEGELRTTRTEDKAWASYMEGFQFPEVKEYGCLLRKHFFEITEEVNELHG